MTSELGSSLNAIVIRIDFWDTAGQEVFNKMHPSYYYRAHCCILVFDVTRKITYQHLNDWYAELREHCPNIPCVLIANKIDADYNVSIVCLIDVGPICLLIEGVGVGNAERVQVRYQAQFAILLRLSSRWNQHRQGSL